MKIAFMDVFEQGNNAEEEITKRLQYCFEKQGHQFYVINRYGYVLSDGPDKGKHVENTDIDFFYTFNHFPNVPVLPDKCGIFFHWAPAGFLGIEQFGKYISNMYGFEDVFGGYESQSARMDALNAGFANPSMLPIGSSVPEGFSLPAKRMNDRKLFYVGINLEKKIGVQRFGNLLKYLDEKNAVNLYGPNNAFGIKGCWDGYKNYKGSIPFDGKSIIEEINKAGIVLALNSPIHHAIGTVSNRTYEAAAAGAVMISDDNPYVRHYFGDSVFYVDINQPEEKTTEQIIQILDWCNKNPEQAYQKALKSQEIFLKHLTLEKMANKAIERVKEIKQTKLQGETVDIVCHVQTIAQWQQLYGCIKTQTYRSLNLILLSPVEVYEQARNTSVFPLNWIDAATEKFPYVKALQLVKSPYFMFADQWTDMQGRHIAKTLHKLQTSDELFAYSGTYIKKYDPYGSFYYQSLNDKQIIPSFFCSFMASHGHDIERTLDCEDIFAKSAPIFKKEILSLVKTEELKQISRAVHYYLALLSIYKTGKEGLFTRILTSGYRLQENQTLFENVFPERKGYWENKKIYGTVILELYGIFCKYSKTFPACDEKYVHVSGPISSKIDNQDIDLENFISQLKKHPSFYQLMRFLSRGEKKNFPNKKERIFVYVEKHNIWKKTAQRLLKK